MVNWQDKYWDLDAKVYFEKHRIKPLEWQVESVETLAADLYEAGYINIGSKLGFAGLSKEVTRDSGTIFFTGTIHELSKLADLLATKDFTSIAFHFLIQTGVMTFKLPDRLKLKRHYYNERSKRTAMDDIIKKHQII